MKNKILVIILAMFLSLPAISWAVEETVPLADEQPAAEEVVDNTQQLDEDYASAVENIEQPDTPYKQPISKKKIVKKFLFAMFGVLASSLILYFGLTIYNRIREGFANRVKTPEGETPLQSPVDLEGAVKTFLDKTKW